MQPDNYDVTIDNNRSDHDFMIVKMHTPAAVALIAANFSVSPDFAIDETSFNVTDEQARVIEDLVAKNGLTQRKNGNVLIWNSERGKAVVNTRG